MLSLFTAREITHSSSHTFFVPSFLRLAFLRYLKLTRSKV